MNNDFKFKRLWGPVPRYPNVEKYVPPGMVNDDERMLSVAGPCSVESAEQIHEIAHILGKCGIKYLRGGVFRAGTYPPGEFGWISPLLISEFHRAARENSMQTIIEILDYDPNALLEVSKYADCYQIGARQMQNYNLLHILSRSKRKVFLKRNVGATIDEFLGAAEYLLRDGFCEPILIERGSSTYHNHVRWDLSISMIPAIKAITQIPIIIDVSHGTGRRDLVEPMALAGIAAGADGYLIETHPNPDKSLSDADQAYPLDQFPALAKKINDLKNFLNSKEEMIKEINH